MPEIAEYGFWKSPVTSDVIAASVIRLGALAASGGAVYWLEGRPAERGRNALVRRAAGGKPEDAVPAPYNVRTRVHEYGGGAYLAHDDNIWFSNFSDQRLYRVGQGNDPIPLTPESGWRYADYSLDAARERLYAVGEDHSRDNSEPMNAIVALDANEPSSPRVLIDGADFYSNPRLSPDGERLCWLEWRHPNMPWDGTELWTAKLSNGGVTGAQRVAGGAEESVFQPQWGPDGALYFSSDHSGWWNLYRWRGGGAETVVEMDAEIGLPQWVFGMAVYALASDGRIVFAYNRPDGWRLATARPGGGQPEKIRTPYSDISDVCTGAGKVWFRGGSPEAAPAIVELDLASGATAVLRSSSTVDPGLDAYVSKPETVEFPTEGGRTAYAFFYAPHNPGHAAPEGEKPPLVVISHGGPTGQSGPTLDWRVQYWTSRGFGVADVNYGGSTGYGRPYRERLAGQWGVVDVDDCVNAAKHLAETGRADGERLIVRGGSAGGYTTLAALAFRDVFRAGASYYGVSDLEALARDTHKFESRYLDKLIGPYPGKKALYIERSPIHSAGKLSAPVAFFQGSEDKIVPPNQTESMVEALRAKGVPVLYLLFDGEQHGFRDAGNIKRALDAELYFYATVLLRRGLRF